MSTPPLRHCNRHCNPMRSRSVGALGRGDVSQHHAIHTMSQRNIPPQSATALVGIAVVGIAVASRAATRMRVGWNCSGITSDHTHAHSAQRTRPPIEPPRPALHGFVSPRALVQHAYRRPHAHPQRRRV